MSNTIRDLLRAAATEFQSAGVADPHGDGRHLMAFAIGCPVDRITTMANDEITPEQLARFLSAIKARAQRQPVSHILGKRAFWNHDFDVNADVLDPRPDTEILVEQALAAPFETLLDLGTGSGCIALSLLAERPEARGVASDISAASLAVARGTAERLGLLERVEFCQSDWFAEIDGQFDLIVSNPPYIRQDEMTALEDEVRLWEPTAALTPGPEGLEAYRRIAANILKHLNPGGRALFEIGPDQAQAVTEIFAGIGLTGGTVHRDFDGRDRVVAFAHPALTV